MDTTANPALAAYLAAFDRPNDPKAAALLRQGMPETPNRALVSYGNTPIVPALDELPGAAYDAATNIMTALPPFGPEAQGLMAGAGALNRVLRYGWSPDAEPAVSSIGAPRPVPPPPGPTTAVPSVGRQALDRTEGLLDIPRGEQVPDPPFRADEFRQVLDELRRNPYSQPIKGRQGIPTKAEQLRLARRRFDDPTVNVDPQEPVLSPSPWGNRSPEQLRADIRRLLEESVEAERSRPKTPPGSQ